MVPVRGISLIESIFKKKLATTRSVQCSGWFENESSGLGLIDLDIFELSTHAVQTQCQLIKHVLHSPSHHVCSTWVWYVCQGYRFKITVFEKSFVNDRYGDIVMGLILHSFIRRFFLTFKFWQINQFRPICTCR